MKQRFNSLVVILLVLALTSGVALGAEGEKADPEVLKLSLEDAVVMARENNQQVKLAKLALEKAELARSQYRFQDKKIDDAIRRNKEILNDPASGIEDRMKAEAALQALKEATGELSAEHQAEAADLSTKIFVDLGQRGVEAALRGIEFGVEGSYYGAIFARDSLSIAEAALKRQEDMLRIAEAKFKAGTVAQKEVMDAKVQVAKARAEVVKAQSEKEKAYMNLKQLLGLNLDQLLELDYIFEYEPLAEKAELKELLEGALKRRIDIAQAQGELDLAQLDFDYTKKAYPSITFVYKQKEHALLEAQLKLEEAKIKVEREIRGLLLDLQEAETNIPLLEESVAMGQESLRLAKLSYEAGMLRRVDVDAAEEGLRQVELQQAMVISNYNLTKLKLENVTHIATTGGM